MTLVVQMKMMNIIAVTAIITSMRMEIVLLPTALRVSGKMNKSTVVVAS